MSEVTQRYHFDGWTLEPAERRLQRGAEVVALEPRTFDVLAYLVANAPRLVAKDEILRQVWRDTVVSDNSLTRAIARLRKALGDDPKVPKYIETIHSKGYRFLLLPESEELALAEPTVGVELFSTPPAMIRFRPRLLGILGALVGLGLLAWLGMFWVEGSGDPPAVALDPWRIAVLPLADHSPLAENGGASHAYLAEGLTEQLTSMLASVEGLKVIPRTTMAAYATVEKSIAEIGRELRAGSLIEGSLEGTGDGLRLHIRLVDTARDEILWSSEFSARRDRILEVQSTVALRVIETLSMELRPQQRKSLLEPPTRSTSAFHHYLRGRQWYRQQTRIGNEQAIEAFGLALAADPQFALAHAGLANAYAMRVIRYGFDAHWRDEAEAAAGWALAIDPDLPEAHKALGLLYDIDERLEEALASYQRALDLAPGYAEAAYNAATTAYALGRRDQAVEFQMMDLDRPTGRAALAISLFELGLEVEGGKLAQEVQSQEPLDGYLACYLALRSVLGGDLLEGRRQAARLTQVYPLWWRPWWVLAEIESRAGFRAQGQSHLEKAVTLSGPGDWEAMLALAATLQNVGDQQRAAALLEKIERDARSKMERGSVWHVHPFRLAAVAALEGRPNDALKWLEASMEAGRLEHRWDAIHPAFESLRQQPGFGQLLERMQKRIAEQRQEVLRRHTRLGTASTLRP